MAFAKRWKWYFKRIRHVSILELLYRLKWKIKQLTFERFMVGKENKDELFNQFVIKNNKDSDSVLKLMIKNANKQQIIAKADNYCNHIFSFYDIDRLNIGKDIDWHKDYKTRQKWPKIFYGKIDHNSTETGDIKYVWEINRFNHFFELGAAYYLTKNEKYSKEIVSEIESWINQNPYLIGVNWFSSLEIALRLISWTLALQFIKQSKSLNKELYEKIIRSIYQQSDFIYHNLSFYSSANNHLIGETTALAVVSSLYPFLNNSDKWHKKAKQVLSEQFEKQIYEDGVGVEQAVNYLAFILNFYLLSIYLGNISFPEKIKKKIGKSANFLANILSLNQEAQIGDCANDYACGFGRKNVLENYLSILNALGIKNKLKNKSGIFSIGGYYFLRSSDSTLLFDCGKLGYDLCFSGHGHADALSFIFSYKGKEFFIDSGTYSYHNNLRNYFRSTSAHNTLMVNGKEQSAAEAEFIWQKKADSFVKILDFGKEKDIVSGYHDGFSPVLHERKIVSDKKNKTFYIIDKIKGNESDIKMFFHVSPDVKIIGNKNKYILKNENARIKIIFDSKLDVKIEKEFYSPSYGVKEQIDDFKLSNRNKEGKEFTTKIKLL